MFEEGGGVSCLILFFCFNLALSLGVSVIEINLAFLILIVHRGVVNFMCIILQKGANC